MNLYDDPYVLLAHHLIADLTPRELERCLTDSDFIRRMIIKELRGLDFRGPFCDTIIEDILAKKLRMEMCRELDKFSNYLFSRLDLPRLRGEIIKYGRLYSIITI